MRKRTRAQTVDPAAAALSACSNRGQSRWKNGWEKGKAWANAPKGKDDAPWLCLAIAFWLILWIDRVWLCVAAILAGALWLNWRFRHGWPVLVWIGLGAFAIGVLMGSAAASQRVPQEGEYRICEIRSGYAMASNKRDSVIVYEPESFVLDQTVFLSDFERIHSADNIGLFSFGRYVAQKGIYYSAAPPKDDQNTPQAQNLAHPEKARRQEPETIKARVWRFVNSRRAASLYRLLIYGINDKDELDWIGTLGLPLMGLLGVIKKRLSRRLYKPQVSLAVFGILGGFALIVPVSISVMRMAVFLIASTLFENRAKRLSFSILTMLLICPQSARSMSLVLPGAILFFTRFVEGSGPKRFVSSCVCVLCQIAFTGKVNLFFLLAFTWLRQLFGWLFLLSLLGLFWEEWGTVLEKGLSSLDVSFEAFDLHGMAPLWYFVLLCMVLMAICWKWSKGRALLCLVLFGLYPAIWHFDPFYHVYMLSVGQGDATVLVEPFMKSVVMIDAAGRFNHDNASELFIPFFQSRQISQLDALIVTHGDFDHNGAVASLCEQFPVKKKIKESGQIVPVDYPFELLLPQRQADPDDENDQSLISRFAFDGFFYLWTGDASTAIEEQLLDRYVLSSDVLKLGHHGSSTSSSWNFIKECDPQLALISAGYKNRYGHPSNEVLLRLSELGIDRLNTADHGMVHLQSFHGCMKIETADGLTAWIGNKKEKAALPKQETARETDS